MSETPFSLGADTSTKEDIQISTPPTNMPSGGLWLPVDMPSMGLAGYPAQIQVRKFGLPDLARLGAARKLNSYSHMVNAIGATIHDLDVRLLTHGDFDFLIYWHAINSLPKSSTKVRWTSRYGYVNELTVDKTMRKTIVIEDANKVEELKAKGYDFSRVGDTLWRLHMQDINKFNDPENEIEFGLATWIKVADPLNFESKLAAIRGMADSLEFYEGLDNWREVANHGVIDTVKVTCEHFDPLQAIDRVSHAISLLDSATTISEYDDSVDKQLRSLLEELAKLRKLEFEGRLAEAKAEEEEIIIPLDVNNFFPVLL